jgi:dTMP kinase
VTSSALARGVFVVLEGGEGAGKSTQVRMLKHHLEAAGYEVVATREPGGVPTAEAIRDLVLDPGNAGLSARAEALLFAAARAEHVQKLIRPALDRGAIVVCDRFIDSSLAYQGIGRGLGLADIATMSAWATDGLTADLTVVLDIDPVDGLTRAARASEVPDRMESEPETFHHSVRDAFLSRARGNVDTYLVVDATADVADIAAQIAAEVVGRIRGG